MAERLVYVSRLVRLPLIGADGGRDRPDGRCRAGPARRATRRREWSATWSPSSAAPSSSAPTASPRWPWTARGCSAARSTCASSRCAPGETLIVGALFERRVGEERVVDVAIRPAPDQGFAWEVATVALGGAGCSGAARPARRAMDCGAPAVRRRRAARARGGGDHLPAPGRDGRRHPRAAARTPPRAGRGAAGRAPGGFAGGDAGGGADPDRGGAGPGARRARAGRDGGG